MTYASPYPNLIDISQPRFCPYCACHYKRRTDFTNGTYRLECDQCEQIVNIEPFHTMEDN